MTLKEEQEYNMIKDIFPLRSRQVDGWPTTHGLKDPSTLPNNKYIALTTMKSTEKRLMRDPNHASLYTRHIDDMLQRGASRIVSEAELE